VGKGIIFITIRFMDSRMRTMQVISNRGGAELVVSCSSMMEQSHLQGKVSQSTTEAEYYSLSETFNEIKRGAEYLNEIGICQRRVTIFDDNTSAINIATNPISHPDTKQIEIKYHLLLDQLADTMTKALEVSKFKKLTARFME
jgi:hypothetical protein